MSTQFLQTSEGSIAYEEQGSGPLVMCVPSMGDLRGEYRFLAPRLAQAGYRAISMDVRGHGESSTSWPDYSVGAIGSDILALIRHLESGPATIIGTSMAGGAGIWAAAEAPELVSGLVLVDAFYRGTSKWQEKLLFYPLFSRPWGPAMWLSYYKTLYPTRSPDDFTRYTQDLKANLSQPGRMESVVKMLFASKEASEKRLPGVKAPALVLMGSKDRDFKDPEGEAKVLADRLGAPYTMIVDAGHYPHAEMPEVTAPLVIAFLQSLGVPQASSRMAEVAYAS
jgi:pimeloyl-ACP methyl ester carboxylesterase